MTYGTTYGSGAIDDIARVPEVAGTPLGATTPNQGQTVNFLAESVKVLKTTLGEPTNPAAGSALKRIATLETSNTGTNTGDETASRVASLINGDSSKLILQQLYQQGVSKQLVNVTTPWFYAPSGTVVDGAAGAAYVTLGTALPAAIPVSGKVYLPAVGSLSAGWYDFSSATTTQVNLVAAVATGGAYTATTGAEVAGPSYSLAGGTLGPNGFIDRVIEGWTNNSAGQKFIKVYSGAALIWQLPYFTSVSFLSPSTTKNRNSQRYQQTAFYSTTTPDGTSIINAFLDPQIDLSLSSTISLTFRLATATDYICLLGWRERATYGA